MKRKSYFLLLLICIFMISMEVKSKNYLVHTIQYQLSAKKLYSMYTVELHDKKLPAFIMFSPEVKVSQQKLQELKNSPFTKQIDIVQEQFRIKQEQRIIAIGNFHKKLQVPLRIQIHNLQNMAFGCIIDEPWDLCVIQNPPETLQFSVHCQNQLSQNPSLQNYSCKGQAFVRQANMFNISQKNTQNEQKTKYQSGLFTIPKSNKHSLMLISCQDDDLPLFAQSLRLYSNTKYHRYERQNKQQIKQMIGIDRTDLIQNSVGYVYFDIQQTSVKKCIQFEYFMGNRLINDRELFDFVNITDSNYKNVYDIVKTVQPQGLQKQKYQQVNYFKYHMQISLNVFKPVKFSENQEYDIYIALIDKDKRSMIVSYRFPLLIQNHSSSTLPSSTQGSTSINSGIYSRSNHYHFTYIIGHSLINQNVKQLQIQLSFQPKAQYLPDEQSGGRKNNYFFISLDVEDMQNIVVQKLTTTYLSFKKQQHATFLIQEPYEISQIKGEVNGQKIQDLVEIKQSSQVLKKKLSQYSSDHEHLSQCHFSKGCKFQITSTEDCLNCKIQYKASFIKGPDDIMLVQVKNNRFLGKIDVDQIQYFYKELKPQEVFQIIVNTPNIIVYTLENEFKIGVCRLPKKSCHSQIVTSHQMIVLENKSKDKSQIVYFAVQGLDKTRFIITLVGSQSSLRLSNGQTFTYKIPAQKQQLQLIYDIPGFTKGKQYDRNISINLVSPLNSLEIILTQLNEDYSGPETLQISKGVSGYIKLNSKQIKSPKLKIVLKKTLHYFLHPVHFTMIASTSDHKFRLDPGITHYQTFDSTEQKTFLIDFEDRQQYEINFHFYDTQDDQISFNVAIFNPIPNQWGKSKEKNMHYKIGSKDYSIFLNQEIIDEQDLCPQNDPDCTLFVMISSMMAHEVEVSLTFLTSESVIELKDGIWHNYKLDELLIRSHFYFIPVHGNNSVKIFFKSTNPQVYLTAILYDNTHNVNPAEWPFPQTHSHQGQTVFTVDSDSLFKQNHLIQIDNDDPQYKKCFPHCVILLSIAQSEDKAVPENAAQKSQNIQILASNNQIELPEKMRMTLDLKENQQQLVFINLRHAFKQKKQILTFFTNFLIGYGSVYARVYLPSIQNIPDISDYDLLFEPIKTQIPLIQIQDIFMQNIGGMQQIQTMQEIFQTQQLYLVLLIQAHQNTKMTIQYTTDFEIINQLELDSVQNVYLSQNQQRLYQFIPTRDQKIKFIRNRGYPLFHQFKCQGENYDNCLKTWLETLKLKAEGEMKNLKKDMEIEQQLQNSPTYTRQRVKQIAELEDKKQFPPQTSYQVLKKTQTQHVIQCQKCIIFIWIYALQQAQLIIQLQSLSTQISLKQNQLVTDYLEVNQYHRYYLPRVQKQFTTIVVTINEGDPIVTVTDNLSYKQIKKGSDIKQKGRKVMLFTIPPVKVSEKNVPARQQYKITSFNTIFSNLHVSLTPQYMKPVSYSITYSSGMHEMFLKNGVISSHFLFENQKTVFYYQSQNKQHKSLLTVTVQANQQQLQSILKQLEIQMYALILDKQTNTLTRSQFLSQRPSSLSSSLKKQSTLTYQIPASFQNIQIDILSTTTTKITIGISNNKLVYLPMSYQYPLYLQPKEQIKFVIQSLEQNYLQLIIKKCDQSNPLIFYTNQQQQFRDDVFSNYDKFSSGENVFKHIAKTKGRGTLYLKIKADPKDKSILLITSRYVDPKDTNFVDMDPGNMGVIQYQFQNLGEVKLMFTGLECAQQCISSTEYYLIRGKSLPKLYKQMVCAGKQMVKLFESKPSLSKQPSSSQFKSKNALQTLASQIIVQRLLDKPNYQTNTFELTIPTNIALDQYSFVTIKAVNLISGEEVYYKPVQIKTLKSNAKNFSSNVLLGIIASLVVSICLIIWITQKLSRKGYVHVGQDQTMIA